MSLTGLFLIETGPGSGLGHLARGLALAQWLERFGGRPLLAPTDGSETVVARIRERGFEPIGYSPGQEAELIAETGADWLIADGYGFDPALFHRINGRKSASILQIDDFQGPVAADLILNQNLNVDPDLYAGCSAELLIGPEYCLLPPGLRDEPEPDRKDPRPRVLITLGGLDPQGWSLSLALALAVDEGLGVDLVVGPWARTEPGLAELETHGRVRIHRNPPSLDSLIRAADLAVMCLGVTTWEMAVRGLPFIMLPVHPAQIPTAEWLAGQGLAWPGLSDGPFDPDEVRRLVLDLLNQPEVLSRASQGLRDLIDGQGGRRVVEAMTGLGGKAA